VLPSTAGNNVESKEAQEEEPLMTWPPTEYFFSIAIDETESESNRAHAFELLLNSVCSTMLTGSQRKQVWQSMADIFTASFFSKRTPSTSTINKTKSVSQQKGYDVAVCGHIHYPKLTDNYMNSGDFCENSTCLVEDFKGNWSIMNIY
jgi:UDP-2,3-diacylglucosamine pyrophosphatase LpxH